MRDENQNSALMQAKVEWYKEVVLLDPQSKLFLSYARLLAELGVLENNPDYYNEAFRVLRAGIEKHPDFMEARLFLIELLHSCDCKAQCGAEVAHLASLFLSYPDFWDAWRVHAGLENQSEDFTVALGFMGAILKDRSLSLVKVFEAGLSALRVEQNASFTMSKELLQGVECALEQPLKSEVEAVTSVQDTEASTDLLVNLDDVEDSDLNDAQSSPKDASEDAPEDVLEVSAEATEMTDVDGNEDNTAPEEQVEQAEQVEQVVEIAQAEQNEQTSESVEDTPSADTVEAVAENSSDSASESVVEETLTEELEAEDIVSQAPEAEESKAPMTDESQNDFVAQEENTVESVSETSEETSSVESQVAPKEATEVVTEEAIANETVAEVEDAGQTANPTTQSEVKKAKAPIVLKASSKPTISLSTAKVKPKISIVSSTAAPSKKTQVNAEDKSAHDENQDKALEEGSIKEITDTSKNVEIVQESVSEAMAEMPADVKTVEQAEQVQETESTSEEILKEEIALNEVAQESSIENKMPQEMSPIVSSSEDLLQEEILEETSEEALQEASSQEADFSLAGKGISEDDFFVPVAVDAIDLSDSNTKDGKPSAYESKDNVKDVLAALLANTNIVEEPMEQSPFRTRSMAEVLAEQGDIKGAIDIYAELIAKQESALIDGDGSADGLELSSLLKRRKELEVRQHLSAQAPANEQDAVQEGWSAEEIASESFENDLPENALLNQLKSQALAQDDDLQNQNTSEQALTENTDDDTSKTLEVAEKNDSEDKPKESKTKNTDKAVDILNKLAMRLEAKAS